MNRLAHLSRGELIAAGVAGAGALVIGMLAAKSPVYAGLLLGALGVGIAIARYGVFAAAASAFALLPWLVIFEGKVPNQVGTLAAFGGAVTLLVLVWPLEFKSRLLPIAAFFLFAVTTAHFCFATDQEQYIQWAKEIVFIMIGLATTSVRGQELLPRFKKPVYGSCVAAMVVHGCIIAAGLGEVGTYYHAGERLGFTGEAPHPLALMTMIIACAGLCNSTNLGKVAGFGLGAVPAALTGVRSALIGLAVALFAFLFKSEVKMKAVLVLSLIAIVAFATGALDVVTSRFTSNANEFSSFSSAGSGRGLIWTVALNAWNAAGPVAWVFGTGLRSIPKFELAAMGKELIGHSDIVEVLVQFGAVGFAAWAAIWTGLLRSGSSPVILLPILTYGVVNGSLEYVAPLATGLVLAAAFGHAREDESEPET
jgi:O-Antigen ligase